MSILLRHVCILFLGLAIFTRLEAMPPPLTADSVRLDYEPDAAHTAVQVRQILDFHLPRLRAFFQVQDLDSLRIAIVTAADDWQRYRAQGAPAWAGGLFFPGDKTIVLNLTSGNATLQKLENVLVHELSHAFFDHAFHDSNAPTWFNEGIAEHLSGGIFEMNTLLLANTQAAGKLPGLDELADMHTFPRRRAELAYTISLTAVQFLLSELAADDGWTAFAGTVRESGWTAALAKHLHTDDIGFEIDWYDHIKDKYRWQVIFNIENLLWVAAGLLVILAFGWKTWRNRRRMRQWARQEAHLPPPPPPPDDSSVI